MSANKDCSDGNRDVYRFTRPLALDCLSLLAPCRRVGSDSYRVAVEPTLQPLLDRILGCRSVLQRELWLIIAFIFDPPPVAELYVVARPLIKHVLDLFQPQAIGTIQEAMTAFYDLLHETRLAGAHDDIAGSAHEALVYGYQRSHLLWAMHVLGAKIQRVGKRRQRVNNKMTPGFRKYGLAAHLAFRQVEMYYLQQQLHFSEAVRADHLYQCSLSLRYFLQLSWVEEGTQVHPSATEIARFMRTLARKWGITKPPWPFRLALHERNVTEAFNGTWAREQGHATKGDPGGPHQKFCNDEPLDNPLPGVVWMAPEEPPQVWRADRAKGVSVYMSDYAGGMAVGEGPEDYAIDHLEIPGAGRDRLAAQMAAIRAAQRLHRDIVLFRYGIEYLQLHEYAWLYQTFDAWPWVEWTPTEQAVITILKLWIHLGGELNALLESEVQEGAILMGRPGDGFNMDANNNRVSVLSDSDGLAVCRPIPSDWSGYRKAETMASDRVSRPVCQQVRLVPPPFLQHVLSAYLLTRRRLTLHPRSNDHGRLFLRGGDPPAPLSREDIVEFLRTAGAPDAGGVLRRLARSFLALYVGRLGLDPLLAAYVSGTRWRLVTSQSFYRHIDADLLNAEYAQKAEAADMLIRAALAGGAEETQHPTPTGSSVRAAAGPGYGSRIVPMPRTLQRFIAVVQTRLDRLQLLVDEHNCIRYINLYMAYAYVMFELLSGARPLKDGGFSEALASPHPERIRLTDKKSTRYTEVRTLKRRATLNDLRREIERAYRFARDLPSFQLNLHKAMGRPILFFVDWDGQPIAAGPGEVRKQLDEIPEVGEAFPWPLNVGRHVWETALGEAGTDRQAKDYALGHTRRWAEPLGRFSAADVTFFESEFAAHVDTVTAQLGLEILSFRPGDEV